MKAIDKIQEVKFYIGNLKFSNIIGVKVYTDNLNESSVILDIFVRVSKDTTQEERSEIGSILDEKFEDCSFTIATSDTSLRPGIEV